MKIISVGEMILKKKAVAVTSFQDPALGVLIECMIQTMYELEGVGLAANQVGSSLDIFVMDVKDGRGPTIHINPKIISTSGEPMVDEEGCLSVKGIYDVVSRPSVVQFEYQDLAGEKHAEIIDGGLRSRCVQHEIDHLNGRLFIDHFGPVKRDMLIRKFKKGQKRV